MVDRHRLGHVLQGRLAAIAEAVGGVAARRLVELHHPEEVGEVPLSQECITLGVVEEGRCKVRVQGMLIAERVLVEANGSRVDRVFVRAAVSPDEGGFTFEIHAGARF